MLLFFAFFSCVCVVAAHRHLHHRRLFLFHLRRPVIFPPTYSARPITIICIPLPASHSVPSTMANHHQQHHSPYYRRNNISIFETKQPLFTTITSHSLQKHQYLHFTIHYLPHNRTPPPNPPPNTAGKAALPPRTSWSRSHTTTEHHHLPHHMPVSASHSHNLMTSSASGGLPSRMGSLRRTGIPTARPTPPPSASSRHHHHDVDGGYRSLTHTPSPGGFRSNSAIDVHAARRAQARAQYANANRIKAGSGVSLRK